MFLLRDSKEKDIMPFGEGFLFPLKKIDENLKNFCCLTLFFAVCNALVTILLGRGSICFLPKDMLSGVFCSQAVENGLISFGLTLVGFGLFFNRWQIIFKDKKTFLEVLRCRCVRKDIKSVFIVFAYFLLWFLLIGFALLLNQRNPNEYWVKEMLFFGGVSLLIIFDVFLFVNFVIFQHYLNGGKLWVLNKTFLPLYDDLYKIVMWFSLYLFLFLLVMQYVLGMIRTHHGIFNLLHVFGYEVIIFFVFYSFVAIFSAMLAYQEEKLLGKEK